ncbi:hypothetical protein PIB30_090907 [Stylosanthes scabra]|uniref:Uncharacterized protein n=1 Tax=Stylosanthes scabra TaxID=79078 RepID=A0ABU6TTV7_9FABA|nr:hypothetical protein [Stylosanthes scabra]
MQASQDLPSFNQGHIWTKFQTWPKRDSPPQGPRLAAIFPLRSEIYNKDKLRKQSKQTHEISSEEVFEEVSDNMAAEGTQQKTLGEYSVPTTSRCGSSIVR